MISPLPAAQLKPWKWFRPFLLHTLSRQTLDSAPVSSGASEVCLKFLKITFSVALLRSCTNLGPKLFAIVDIHFYSDRILEKIGTYLVWVIFWEGANFQFLLARLKLANLAPTISLRKVCKSVFVCFRVHKFADICIRWHTFASVYMNLHGFAYVPLAQRSPSRMILAGPLMPSPNCAPFLSCNVTLQLVPPPSMPIKYNSEFMTRSRNYSKSF